MKKKTKLQFKIIKLDGRSRRVEIGEFTNTIGSLVGGFMTLAIATVCLGISTDALKQSGILKPESQSKIRLRAREATRV